MEVEQPQRVGDGRAGLANPLGDHLLGEAELVDELAVGGGLVDGIQVSALDVLDQGHLELVAIRELADERGDPLKPGEPRCPHAPLAGDQLVAVQGLGDEDGLEDAVLPDARGELREVRVVHVPPRLVGIRDHARERHLDDRGGARGALGDQRGEAPAQRTGAAIRLHRHATAPASAAELGPRRARSSPARAWYASAPLESGR